MIELTSRVFGSRRVSFECELEPEERAIVQGVICFMDYIDKVLEKIRDWARRIVDALLGPEVEPEAELIPIPVDRRRYR